MSNTAFLPWAAFSEAAGSSEDFSSMPAENDFVEITAVLHGRMKRSVSLLAPRRTTCAEMKELLAAEGVVSGALGGLRVLAEEGGQPLEDSDELEVEEGKLVHLRSAAQSVSVTVLTTAAAEGGACDEEVYEIVLPSETSGAALRAQVEEATAGALRPLAIFVMAAGGEEAAAAPAALADGEPVVLAEHQVLLVQRAPPACEATAPQSLEVAVAAPAGLLGALRGRLLGGGRRSSKGVAAMAPPRLCLRSAANLRVRGSRLACTSAEPWAGCAVFSVADAGHFEVTVQLLEDAPAAEAEGLAGRWMLGVAPSAVAEEVKTQKQRQQLLGLGYFMTVCHGHPAKIHAPSMPRGTCGEDCQALPGELRKGQRLTLRFTKGKHTSTLQAQVDDGDEVTLPYAPAPFDDVRPCLAFGGKPAELRILQLEAGAEGGA